MDMEKLLAGLFDFQRFERDPALERVLQDTEARYFSRELSEDDLRTISAADDLPNELIRRETLERLAAALNTLEPEERDIIVLRYYKGQTLTEISRLTDISYGMVRVKHNRALRALRVQLE